MKDLQEFIDIAIASGIATIYFTLGFLFAMVAEVIAAVIDMFIEKYKQKKLHPKKLLITLDLAKLPNNVYRYHQLNRGRHHEDFEDYIYSILIDYFVIAHTENDLEELSSIGGDNL